MASEFFAFGEILWDCLPSGRHAGGAPFNVTAHLAQIGVSASLISCIGRDSLVFMAGLMVGLTRGTDTRKVLENACRLGAFVASHNGATPLLPPEIIAEFTNV
jgi:sugar/nucleoside kinase (ribokinase family)